jgi:hypothetical protein
MDNDDSALGGYVSSVDPYQADQNKPSIDAPDEKTLVGLMRMVEKEIKLFHTISGMKRFDTKKFNADQREAMCNQHVQLLLQFLRKVTNAIDGIKEAQNG